MKKFEETRPLLIGRIFLEMADYLKIYIQFCSNQPKAEAFVNELIAKSSQFEALLQEKRFTVAACRELTFQAFICKPMQRICKYKILLSELLKYTRNSHPDYENLTVAIDLVGHVMSDINESKRRFESNHRIVEIQKNLVFEEGRQIQLLIGSSRCLLREGNFKLVLNKKSFTGYLLLFTDILLVCRVKQSKWYHKCTMFMNTCLVLDGLGVGSGIEKKKKSNSEFPFSVIMKDDHLIVYTKEVEDKNEWITDIKKINEY